MGSRARIVVALVVGSLALAVPRADAVVGGALVPAGSNRFVASLRLDGDHRCGASVISARWLLTAAHCVEGITDARHFTVALGDVDRTHGRVVQVDRSIMHTGYSAQTMANDVAVLHITADAGVPAVRLAGPADDALEADGAPLVVAGWGSELSLVVVSLPSIRPQMKQAQLRAVGDDRCNQADDPATQLCAAALLTDSCQGDSGGPLFATTPQGPVQVGTVSYGLGCGLPGFPGVYGEVNAPSIRNWIRQVTAV